MANDHSLNTPAPSAQDQNPVRAKPRSKKANFEQSPHLLIGGDKNLVSPMKKPKTCFLQVSIDWLTFTVPKNGETDLEDVCFSVCAALRGNDFATLRDGPNTLKGCQKTQTLAVVDVETGEMVPVGKVGTMAATKSNRAMYVFSITGEGCAYFDMSKLSIICFAIKGAKITRVDTAMDDFEGDFTVRRAQMMYRAGKFQSTGKAHGGKMPLSNFMEKKDGGKSLGKTFYVGDRKNGKMLRVYEKGIKEGDELRPDWVRWEVQFGNKDRVVPWDILTNPSTYFLGAYAPFPALFGSRLCDATATHIKTEQNTKSLMSMRESLRHVRLQSGKLLKIARLKVKALNLPSDRLLDLITRDGVPSRLIMPTAQAVESLFGDARLCPFDL